MPDLSFVLFNAVIKKISVECAGQSARCIAGRLIHTLGLNEYRKSVSYRKAKIQPVLLDNRDCIVHWSTTKNINTPRRKHAKETTFEYRRASSYSPDVRPLLWCDIMDGQDRLADNINSAELSSQPPTQRVMNGSSAGIIHLCTSEFPCSLRTQFSWTNAPKRRICRRCFHHPRMSDKQTNTSTQLVDKNVSTEATVLRSIQVQTDEVAIYPQESRPSRTVEIPRPSMEIRSSSGAFLGNVHLPFPRVERCTVRTHNLYLIERILDDQELPPTVTRTQAFLLALKDISNAMRSIKREPDSQLVGLALTDAYQSGYLAHLVVWFKGNKTHLDRNKNLSKKD